VAVMPAQGLAAHLKGGKLNKELDCLGPRGLAASDLLSAPRQTSQFMPYEYTPPRPGLATLAQLAGQHEARQI